MQVLKAELDRLATTGLATEEGRIRYRELMQQQEQLRRQAEVESTSR
jgi:DNA primase